MLTPAKFAPHVRNRTLQRRPFGPSGLRALLALLLWVTIGSSGIGFAQEAAQSSDEARRPTSREQAEADFKKATETILCDCGCHPQSVADCTCGRAAEMRSEISQRIQSGMNAEEVIQSYVDESGEQIRIAPVATGFNLIAWLGPLIGLVAATLFIVLLLRHWAKRARVDASSELAGAGAGASTGKSDGNAVLSGDEQSAYRKRLEAELEDFE